MIDVKTLVASTIGSIATSKRMSVTGIGRKSKSLVAMVENHYPLFSSCHFADSSRELRWQYGKCYTHPPWRGRTTVTSRALTGLTAVLSSASMVNRGKKEKRNRKSTPNTGNFHEPTISSMRTAINSILRLISPFAETT